MQHKTRKTRKFKNKIKNWGGIRRVTSCHLCWQIALGLFIAIIIIEAILFFPLYAQYKHELLLQLQQRGLIAVKTLLKVYPPDKKLKQLESAGRIISKETAIKGMVVYNNRGQVVTQFGRNLYLAPSNIYHFRLATIPQLSQHDNMVYVYWSAQQLQHPYEVMALLDASPLKKVLWYYLRNYFFSTLITILYMLIIVMIVVGLIVLFPLLKLRKNLISGIINPYQKPKGEAKFILKNELSDIYQISNKMLQKIYLTIAKVNKQKKMLSNMNEMLEMKVQQRTKSLTESHEKLKLEMLHRKQAEQKIYDMALFPQENASPVLRISSEGRLLYVNPAGVFLKEAWDIDINLLLPKNFRQLIINALQLNQKKQIEEQIKERFYLINIVPIKERNYINLYFADITRRKEYEQQLVQLSTTDPITKLANQHLFAELTQRAITTCIEKNEIVAVLLLEFHDINAIKLTKGLHAHEVLLQVVAKRLKQNLSEKYVIARLPGNVFSILSDTLRTQEEVAAIAEQIIWAFLEELIVANTKFNLTVNVGIAVFPEDGDKSEALIKNADIAMFHAKSKGKNNYQFFVEAMNERVARRQTIIETFEDAIIQNQFELLLQPQHSVKENALIGAEALLRWHHPSLGLINPGEFIPILEESELIAKLTHWILQTACDYIVKIDRVFSDSIRIAINLSASQFAHANLTTLISEILNQSKINPHQLELEITERVAIADVNKACNVMQSLRDLGVQLAIDDFGTDYSSLRYMQKFPVQRIKLDKSFIDGIGISRESEVIIHAIIQLAHNLSMATIAEGVETKEQVVYLQKHQCDEMQGHYFSGPISFDDFVDYIIKLKP